MSDAAGGVFGHVPTLICHRGQEYINPRKAHQKPVWLGFRDGPITAAAGGSATSSLNAPRDRGRDGDVELWKLNAASTGRFSVDFYSQIIDRSLMNSPVESSLIFGRGDLPSRLYESLWIPASSAIKVSCFDLSGAPNVIDVVGEGTQLIAQRTGEELARAVRKPTRHPFWLTFDSGAQVALAAGGSATVTMTIPGDSFYEAFGLTSRSDGTFTVEILEGNQRSVMFPSGVMDSTLVIGGTGLVAGASSASLPNMFATSWVMHPATSLKIRLTDTSAAPNNVSLAFIGRLLYQMLAPGSLTDLNAR